MIGVSLSDKEQKVLLALITYPEGAKAMAQRLNMSRVSVGRYLTTLYRKTGTTNKIGLIRWTLREAYKALRIDSRTGGKAGAGMNLFQAQVHLPDSDDPINVTKALMIVATAVGNAAEQQPAAPAFILSVTEDMVTVQVMRSDGREVFASLFFDGQRFILASEGFIEPAVQ